MYRLDDYDGDLDARALQRGGCSNQASTFTVNMLKLSGLKSKTLQESCLLGYHGLRQVQDLAQR